MGILSRLGMRGKALSGTPGVLELMNQRQFNQYASLGGTNLNRERINAVYVLTQNGTYGWLYRTLPSVRRVIDYLAANVSQLGLKLYERVDDDDRKQVGDHPAALAMRRPNPQTPGKKLIRGLVTDFLTYDNAYALKIRTQSNGRWLYPISPAMVGIIGQSHFQVEVYRIFHRDGGWTDVDPIDMIHWRGENPEDSRRGESKLETLREELAADAAARQANTELHKSGLALPGWIQRPLDAPEITKDGLKRLRESLANQAKTSRREYPILEEGMTFHQGGVTPEDAELLAARSFTQDYVASLYGMKNIPPEGDEERRQFYTDVLPDICGQLTDFLGLQLLEAEYGLTDHYFEFNLDEKLMGDERIKSLTSAAGAPIFTRNEARARVNLPAHPDGDELVTPLNVIEGGKPTPMTMPIQDPNKPSQDGDHREEPQKALVETNGNGNGDEVALVVHKFLERQERSLRSSPGKFNRERWARELIATVTKAIGPSHGEGSGLQRLKDLGVPQELIWERAGLTQAEIDRARVLQMAEELTFDDPDAQQKAINVTVNPTFDVPVGALQFKAGDVTVEPPPPAELTVEGATVNVEPAQTHIHEGAFKSETTVESAPPADIRFDKGAFHVENPVHVEAPPPADVRIVQEPISVNVEQPQVNVAAPEAPNVNVEVKGGKSKKTVTFSDGHTAEISDEMQNKRTVTFSDGRTAEINESEDDGADPASQPGDH